ncbi:sugar ABC transporter permease [Nocardia sp. NEAU-G5]|uniref:Sugar ABC transporter permease n=1 Tax=Nocardia albiluteola TaxID=2842303 RepID=A0ABS6AY61_9NOCA|nr:sugar ABC transporter permease [Nocardia albiluteola]MBU3062989.1 sugar ABC transporter permease [Nocardia albiluteola]
MTAVQERTIPRPRSGLTRKRAAAGRRFIVPNLLAVLIFLLIPLAFSLYLSFQRWDLFHPPRFVGIQNYRRLFTGDRMFYVALVNTVIFTVATVVPAVVISLAVAGALNAKVKGIGFFRSVMFLPLVSSVAAMAVVWHYMFDSDIGVVNAILGWFGIPAVPWLTDPHWALVSLCVVSIWKSVPFAAAVLLAAMQGVPEDLIDAAKIDGAGGFRRFISVVVPLIRPALGFVFVISIINSFQVFDQAYVLTGGAGGPESGTYIFGMMLFQNAFQFDDLGYASALAWVLFAILLLLTYLQLRMGRRGEQ